MDDTREPIAHTPGAVRPRRAWWMGLPFSALGWRQGQHTAEMVTVVAVVSSALITTQTLIRRSVQARVKVHADELLSVCDDNNRKGICDDSVTNFADETQRRGVEFDTSSEEGLPCEVGDLDCVPGTTSDKIARQTVTKNDSQRTEWNEVTFKSDQAVETTRHQEASTQLASNARSIFVGHQSIPPRFIGNFRDKFREIPVSGPPPRGIHPAAASAAEDRDQNAVRVSNHDGLGDARITYRNIGKEILNRLLPDYGWKQALIQLGVFAIAYVAGGGVGTAGLIIGELVSEDVALLLAIKNNNPKTIRLVSTIVAVVVSLGTSTALSSAIARSAAQQAAQNAAAEGATTGSSQGAQQAAAAVGGGAAVVAMLATLRQAISGWLQAVQSAFAYVANSIQAYLGQFLGPALTQVAQGVQQHVAQLIGPMTPQVASAAAPSLARALMQSVVLGSFVGAAIGSLEIYVLEPLLLRNGFGERDGKVRRTNTKPQEHPEHLTSFGFLLVSLGSTLGGLVAEVAAEAVLLVGGIPTANITKYEKRITVQTGAENLPIIKVLPQTLTQKLISRFMDDVKSWLLSSGARVGVFMALDAIGGRDATEYSVPVMQTVMYLTQVVQEKSQKGASTISPREQLLITALLALMVVLDQKAGLTPVESAYLLFAAVALIHAAQIAGDHAGTHGDQPMPMTEALEGILLRLGREAGSLYDRELGALGVGTPLRGMEVVQTAMAARVPLSERMTRDPLITDALLSEARTIVLPPIDQVIADAKLVSQNKDCQVSGGRCDIYKVGDVFVYTSVWSKRVVAWSELDASGHPQPPVSALSAIVDTGDKRQVNFKDNLPNALQPYADSLLPYVQPDSFERVRDPRRDQFHNDAPDARVSNPSVPEPSRRP